VPTRNNAVGPKGCVEGVKERGLIGADNPVACDVRGEERRLVERQNAWKVERERERDVEKKEKTGIEGE
jgi:hypothetical protein